MKGLKGDFAPVSDWFMKILEGAQHFSSLIKKEGEFNAVNMVLNAMKGGIYTKNKDVATCAAKAYAKLSFHLISEDLTKFAWEWFTVADGGLDGILYMMQKHQGMETLAIEIFFNFGKNNLKDLFTSILKNIMKTNLQYWQLILNIIQPLELFLQNRKEEPMEEIIQFWLNSSCREAENDGKRQNEERAVALSVLNELWVYFPNYVEAKDEMANGILTVLKRAVRDKNQALQIFGLSLIFNLFDKFAEEKRKYAPVIYKAIVFSLVENHKSLEIHQFIMGNLQAIYSKFPQIPVSIVIEPLVKQILLSENLSYFNNVFDFEFFLTLVIYPKLTGKHAVQLLDLLGKIILNEQLFGCLVKTPFISLSHNQSSETQDLLSKFVKIALSTMLGIIKKKFAKPKKSNYTINPNSKKLMQAQTEELESDYLSSMQCVLIVEILAEIQAFGSDSLNDQLKNILVSSYNKNMGFVNEQYNPLKRLLDFYGDSSQLIVESEKTLALPESETKVLTEKGSPKPESQGRIIRKKRGQGKDEKNKGNRSTLVEESNHLIEEKEVELTYQQKQLIPYYASKTERDISKKAIKELEKIKKQQIEKYDEVKKYSINLLRNKE